MMPKSIHIVLFAFWSAILLIFSGCQPCRYVPSDKYLLNKAKIVIDGSKEVSSSELNSYLRQKQNSEILGFWKLQLHIYNTAPKDTITKSQKRLTRNAHRMGEAPVIYDQSATIASMEQLKKAMANKGFFRAQVDTSIVYKVKQRRDNREERKVNVTYHITANDPYVIRDYKTNISNEVVRLIANSRGRKVKNGDRFDASILDEERQRITMGMRRHGYYNFDKSMIEYRADSSYSTNEVAMEIKLEDYIELLPDSVKAKLYTQYYIAHVCFHQDYDPKHMPENMKITTDLKDSADGYVFTYIDKRLLRNNVLKKACRIVPGMLYNETAVEETYANLNGLGPVKYIDIAFVPVGDNQLDCHVTLSRSKLNNISAELEGTYSAGDWGIAAGVGYANKNIFRGAEQLSLNGRASYEWRQNGGRAIEGTVDAGLLFPNTLKVNIAYKYQHRPEEYTRTIANAGLYYTAHKSHRNSKWSHQFNLIDISYVYLPYVSDEFRINFLEQSTVLKYSYENHFIVDWSYHGRYNGYNQRHPYRSYVTFNYMLETAGNLLYGISTIARQQKNEVGQYEIFKIPYSQYAKADFNFTFHHVLAPKHQLVTHIGAGAAVPYLNSGVVPFEKRYFAGGSNSVRGWQARALGPGGFSAQGNSSLIYELKAGDIRLDANLEYRYHVLKFLELAAFFDAGNIWTIREYDEQPDGAFHWNEFYKQIALAYGVGVRLDFSFLIFRVDLGVKLYDPARINGARAGTQWRTIGNGLGWNDDMTFHFAIGYPF